MFPLFLTCSLYFWMLILLEKWRMQVTWSSLAFRRFVNSPGETKGFYLTPLHFTKELHPSVWWELGNYVANKMSI